MGEEEKLDDLLRKEVRERQRGYSQVMKDGVVERS